jgi:hypothetical protein
VATWVILAYVGTASSPTGYVVIASFDPSTTTRTAGDQILIAFVFLDSNVDIVGTCTSGSLTVEYDLRLKAGWNLFIYTVVEVSGGSVTKVKATSSTGGVPASLKWWYVASGPAPSLKGLKSPSNLWNLAW